MVDVRAVIDDGHRIVDRDGIDVVMLTSAEAAAILAVLRRALAEDERRNGARHPVLGRVVRDCQRAADARGKSREEPLTCTKEESEDPSGGDGRMIVPMLTVAEVAHELGVTARRVRHFIEDGRLAAVKVAGTFRISPTEFAAFVDDRQEAL